MYIHFFYRYNRRTGFIPSLYLKPYSNPCEKIHHILRRERYVSTPNLLEEKWFGDAYTLLPFQPPLDDQRQSDRERSRSLGATSLGSEARSDQDSDIDSVTGSNSRLSFSNSGRSSLNTSNSSLSTTTCGMPKIPTRPKPEEIIEKCSTVTKKKVQRLLVGIETREVTGTER